MHSRIVTFLCSFCVAVVPVTAQAELGDMAKQQLVRSAEAYAELGERLGDPDLARRGRGLAAHWAALSPEYMQKYLAEMDGFDVPSFLVDLSLDTDRLEDVSESISETGDQRGPVVFPPASCGAFPTPSCSIASSPPSWAALTAAIAATDSASVAEISSATICKKIEITPIEQEDGFHMGDINCMVEAVGALFICGLVAEGFVSGVGPFLVGGLGGGPPFPLGSGALCSGLEQTSFLAEKTQELLEAQLECWEGAYVEATYAGTDTVRCQIEAIASLIPTIQRLQFEDALIRKGGSRPAVFYLDANEEGELERLRGYVHEAITQTGAIGYSLSPKANIFFDRGDAARTAGDVKSAYDWYRKAYQDVTVGSREFVGP